MLGVVPTEMIIDSLRNKIKTDKITDPADVKTALQEILVGMIGEGEPLKLDTQPSVILVIGVNGVGKTTSIAKIANLLKAEGKNVILAAADTFRAAAIDQLKIWADRAGAELISHEEGSDPGSRCF